MHQNENISIKLCSFLFSVYIFANYSVQMLQWPSILLQIPLYGFLVLSLWLAISYYFKYGKTYIYWYGAFTLCSLFSFLYAKSFTTANAVTMYIITALILGYGVCTYLSITKSTKLLKYSFIISAIVVGSVLIMTFKQVKWWDRLGDAFGMNSNIVGLYFAIPFCFSIVELANKNKLIINIISLVVCIWAVFLTGSKKALFALMIFPFVFFILKTNDIQKKLKVIILIMVSLVIGYQLIMRIPMLYDIIGQRIEIMIDTLQNKSYSSQGGSTAERGDMIQYGIKYWKQSPLVGHGINMFRDKYGHDTGHYAYAHNNFVELLADLGILGFVIYYSIYIKLIYSYISLPINQKKINSEFIAFLITLLYFDIAMVSYYDVRVIIVIAYLIMYPLNQIED